MLAQSRRIREADGFAVLLKLLEAGHEMPAAQHGAASLINLLYKNAVNQCDVLRTIAVAKRGTPAGFAHLDKTLLLVAEVRQREARPPGGVRPLPRRCRTPRSRSTRARRSRCSRPRRRRRGGGAAAKGGRGPPPPPAAAAGGRATCRGGEAASDVMHTLMKKYYSAKNCPPLS